MAKRKPKPNTFRRDKYDNHQCPGQGGRERHQSCCALVQGSHWAIRRRDALSPVRRAKEYLHANFKSRPSLQDIAFAIGVSALYLTDLFKRSQGTTLYAYQLPREQPAPQHYALGEWGGVAGPSMHQLPHPLSILSLSGLKGSWRCAEVLQVLFQAMVRHSEAAAEPLFSLIKNRPLGSASLWRSAAWIGHLELLLQGTRFQRRRVFRRWRAGGSRRCGSLARREELRIEARSRN
jgi:hypothetical protein